MSAKRRMTLRRADGAGEYDDLRTVVEIGNSIGVTIDAELRGEYGLEPGDEVGVIERDGGIRIEFPE